MHSICTIKSKCCNQYTLQHLLALTARGIVVRERRSGKYFGAGTAIRQISLATGGTLTLKRFSKSRRTRYVDPRSVYFLTQIAPKRGIWHQKSQKIFPGVIPRTSSAGGATPSRTNPQHGYTPCAGRKLPRCWDLGLRNRSPQIKIYHHTPAARIVCGTGFMKRYGVRPSVPSFDRSSVVLRVCQ